MEYRSKNRHIVPNSITLIVFRYTIQCTNFVIECSWDWEPPAIFLKNALFLFPSACVLDYDKNRLCTFCYYFVCTEVSLCKHHKYAVRTQSHENLFCLLLVCTVWQSVLTYIVSSNIWKKAQFSQAALAFFQCTHDEVLIVQPIALFYFHSSYIILSFLKVHNTWNKRL